MIAIWRQIDMALSVQADETALELFRRTNRKPLRTGLAFLDEVSGSGSLPNEKGVGRGDLVELYGPSGSGKSEVLINVVARCILPAWLGGEERTAVFFDNDGRLSILRLEQLLKGKITSNTTFQVKAATGGIVAGGRRSHQLESDLEAVLVDCLRRLRVVRPDGLFELLAAIEVLKHEVEHRPAVVVVDGMGSFFWQDKMAQSCGGDAVSMQGAVVKALVRLVMERPVVVFAAKSALFLPRGHGSTNSNQDTVEHREYLPQAWQCAVTFRVILQRRQKRPRSLPPASGMARGEGGGSSSSSSGDGALSLFTARVLSLNRGGGGGGSTFKGATAATGRGGGGGGVGSVSGGDEAKPYCFVVTDDGMHDVPAAAALGEGEGWEGR